MAIEILRHKAIKIQFIKTMWIKVVRTNIKNKIVLNKDINAIIITKNSNNLKK